MQFSHEYPLCNWIFQWLTLFYSQLRVGTIELSISLRPNTLVEVRRSIRYLICFPKWERSISKIEEEKYNHGELAILPKYERQKEKKRGKTGNAQVMRSSNLYGN